MKYWTSPLHHFDYSFNEVASVFYDRYPNSFAKHVISEDVIERKISENIIYTKKLIVKKGASFLKSVPKWMSTMTSIQIVPTVEESIYDRRNNTLVTYTRNVAHTNLFHMDEKNVYTPSGSSKTALSRNLFVSINYPRFSSLIERVLVISFRNTIKKTLSGIQEKLEERYGIPFEIAHPSASTSVTEKATLFTDNSQATWKVLSLVSLASLLHCAYSAAQHRSYLRLTEQEFTQLPLDIVIQTFVSLVVLIFSTTFLAGDFQTIRADKEVVRKTWDTIGNCPSFYTFDHRSKCLRSSLKNRRPPDPESVKTAFLYCADLVKKRDYENYLSLMLMPKEKQPRILANLALNAEVSIIRQKIKRNSGVTGIYQLQFWKDALNTLYGDSKGPVPRQPVVTALHAFGEPSDLDLLQKLVAARQETLGDRPFESVKKLEENGKNVHGTLIQLVGSALGKTDNPQAFLEAAESMGAAVGVITLLRATIPLLKEGVVLIPSDLMQIHNLSGDKIFNNKNPESFKALVKDLVDVADSDLQKSRKEISEIPVFLRKGLLSNFEGQSDSTRKKWVRALWEPMTSMEISKDCVAVGDINGDNEYKLVVVDFAGEQCRLKLLKGLTVVNDSFLTEVPAGMVVFVSDPGHSPCVAVAIGSSLLVYRNMKPYYRYNLPQNELHPSEVELWKSAIQRSITVKELFHGLQQLKSEISIGKMSFHSQHFLTLGEEDTIIEALGQIISNAGEKINISNLIITCITTMKKVESTKTETDVIVVGTELGSIFWIDSQAYSILNHFQINGIPDKIFAYGQYELESRLFICTRESDVIVLKKNTQGDFSTTVITMKSPVVSIAGNKNHIVLATRNNFLVFCTFKGKKQAEIQLPEPVIDMETFFYEPKQYSGLLVAFKQHVSIYIDQFVVDTLKVDFDIEWIKFGRFGREDAVLIIGTSAGGIGVHIFRRTALLTAQASEVGPPAAQHHKLTIPKKSKAFIDQSLRERENPQRMHATYQRDLYMLRLHITKAFAELTGTNSGLVPTKDSEKMDINVDVNGFGPCFRVNIRIVVAGEMVNHQRWIAFSCDKTLYFIDKNLIPIPKLINNVEFTFTNGIRCLSPEKGIQGEIKVFILSENRRAPLWTTSFEMPLSEQSIV
ncbi:hypothetical protein FO519_005711 [Halicephalobus sp. NKZ332]|nr:hypothetical protein FO519_005711 [Halicephalobus sp. NKZ332]